MAHHEHRTRNGECRIASPIAFAVIVVLSCVACGKHVKARAPVQPPVAAVIGATENGNASWYGVPYNGRPAASGEIYDMEQLTAAHRTLPFQTWVEVTNLSNGRHVTVRINDRGPFVDGRIIDLSLAAARAVDLVRAGVAPVRLRIVAGPAEAPAPTPIETPIPVAASAAEIPTNTLTETYAIQAGAFAERPRAEDLAERMRAGFPELGVRVVALQVDPVRWRVLVGSALNMDAALALAIRVRDFVGESLVVREQ